MRALGIFFAVLGIALTALGVLLVGNNDVAAMLGGISYGMGGASLIAAMVYLFGKKPRMQ